MDWDNDTLVYGHERGVTVLSRYIDTNTTNQYGTELQRQWAFTKNDIDLGQEVSIVKIQEDILVAAHPDDHTMTVLNISTGEKIKLGENNNGHSSYINSIDISSSGKYILSTGDDRNLIIWENEKPQTFTLAGTGKVAKFWEGSDGDRVIVLEAVNKIRVLDWKKSEWLLTIHPAQSGCCGPSSGSVRDITTIPNGDILAVGLGWWKRYTLTALSGGCGYTVPSSESRFVKTASNPGLCVSGNASFIGIVTPSVSYIHDPERESQHTFSLNYKLPAQEITGLALRDHGGYLAIATGKLLTIIRNSNVTEDNHVIS